MNHFWRKTDRDRQVGWSDHTRIYPRFNGECAAAS